jgi:AcrR family transcriptional regulator
VTLNTIRACFARKGFSGTSIEDLSEATGLGTPSLYNAFGDKRQMFLKSLDLEYEDLVFRLRSVTTGASLADRLRAYLEAATVGYREHDAVPGIAFGAALADASDNSEVARRVRDFSAELELVAAEVLGPNAPPSSAGLLSTLATGLCLRLRSCASSLRSLEHAAFSLFTLTEAEGATGDARRAPAGTAA